MSVITTVSIPAEDFTLGSALAADVGMRVRLERVVPVDEDVIPYLWVSNEAIEDIEAQLRQEADIAAFRIVDSVDDEALVRIEWAERVDGFLDVLARTEATVLEGTGEAGTWRFQLRFDDRDQLTDFYRQCVDDGVALTPERVHNPETPRGGGVDIELTEPQRETLELALERGYFEVPRQITTVELADEMGISDSAVSQRLRRATGTLLGTVLPDSDGSGDNSRLHEQFNSR